MKTKILTILLGAALSLSAWSHDDHYDHDDGGKKLAVCFGGDAYKVSYGQFKQIDKLFPGKVTQKIDGQACPANCTTKPSNCANFYTSSFPVYQSMLGPVSSIHYGAYQSNQTHITFDFYYRFASGYLFVKADCTAYAVASSVPELYDIGIDPLILPVY
ncbi:hypothetical protein [Caudoviricetes sp.]|nr:hypothetical protein [Caudoviricetes sp.]